MAKTNKKVIKNLDFIKALSQETGYTVKSVKEVVDAWDKVAASLLQPDENYDVVEVKATHGLTLINKLVPSRKGRNPQTGEEFMTKPKQRTKTRISGILKSVG